MRGRKRPLSPASPRKVTVKKPVLEWNAIPDDDEDSLESILAQIKAQEESEALARRLQQEWNAPGPSGVQPEPAGPSGTGTRSRCTFGNVIEISDDEGHEDDEAVARRLAAQWEREDATPGCLPPSIHNTSASKGKDKASSEAGAPRSPASVLESYRALFSGERSCSCGSKVSSPRGHVMFSQEGPPSNLLRMLHVVCKSCNTNHCRGCMSPVSCMPSCKGKTQDVPCTVETCCAEVRVIALFEALGGFDKQYLGERATADERARMAAAKARKSNIGSVGRGGTGYGTGHHGGSSAHSGNWDISEYGLPSYGYRRGRKRDQKRRASSIQANNDRRDLLTLHFDEIIVRALRTVTNYLPAPYSENPQIYDMLPHPSIISLLQISQLPDLLGSLLRNDSVTDWIDRIDVYHTMLALLRRLADCELTLEVLIGPRWEIHKSCGLEDWMWEDGTIELETNSETGEPTPGPPLYVHFKKLTKQCEMFLAGASGMLESATDGEDAETMVKATSLCGDIIAAKDDIERAMIVMGKNPAEILAGQYSTPTSSSALEDNAEDNTEGKDKGKDRTIDLERVYARECERLAFQHVSLSRPNPDGSGIRYPEYNYARELMKTATATRNPKDRLHLVKELAMMATSLPPGVWVRVDETRNDAIKIMIAGPEGTPYAGGLFEFDCFIPLDYPNKPPLMHLRTTGGGSVRFNPNLYHCGKVCLSLLGTWQGRPEEQWVPRKSTLLQVVVSIQSMILVDLPYFNEPGYGQAKPTNPESIAYNKNITLQTTRWAIVDWLENKHKDGLWGEVIASHFLTRYEKIKACIQDWATKEPSIRKYRAGMSLPAYAPPMGGSMAVYPSVLTPGFDFGPDLHSQAMVYANSSSMVGGVAPLHSGGLPRRRGKAADTQKAPVLDLLVQFEKGVERVRAWGFAETEQH
ncbi:hypothetical protein C8Q78DRAFT_1019118 [Trametes maxima]|nr:hypothetical protein C8Q78DRAFT_1019118 [Trametes maxima]